MKYQTKFLSNFRIILTVLVLLIYPFESNSNQKKPNPKNLITTECTNCFRYYYNSDAEYVDKVKSNVASTVIVISKEYHKYTKEILKKVKRDTTQFDLVLLENISTQSNMSIQELRLRAFLGTIKFAEGHGKINSYNIIYGGEHVENLDKHPNKKVTKWGYTSTAAGCYGILHRTWKSHAKKLNLTNFSGLSQDLVVIDILRGRKLLEKVMNNNIEELLSDTKFLTVLKGIWTPFPTGSQQGVSFKRTKEGYQQCLVDELNGNTTLELPKGFIL